MGLLKSIFKPLLYYPFLNILIFFIWLVPGHNAAWGIIFLTLVVRIILIIPSKRAAQAQRKLAELQPLIDELREEYAEDRQGLALAQMELYKKNNINPFSSCGLSLIQLPILYILYYVIIHGLSSTNPEGLYSWVPRPEYINSVMFGIDLLKRDPTHILPILAGVLQIFQLKMTMPKHKPGATVNDPAAAMQKQMMYIFPLLTFFIARSIPAGASLYWVITTLFSIGQQYFVNKEKLKLTGVEKALQTADKEHPETSHAGRKELPAVLQGEKKEGNAGSLKSKKREVAETKTGKKGVSVTVRKKGSR